MNTSTFP